MSNSQAIRNQLIAAIIMCLVAAIALGASTFAWFVNNNTATADGMKVQAKAESGLLIRLDKTNPLNWNTTASGEIADAKIILPTSTLDSTWWTHTNAIAATASGAKTGVARENVTEKVLGATALNTATLSNTTIGGVDSDYASIRQFKFASSTANSKIGLKVNSVTATYEGTKTAMINALRVGIKCGEKFIVYSPVDKKTTSYDVYDANGAKVSTQVALTAPTTSTELDTTTVLASSANNGNLIADVFIWFEGEDADLYTNQFSDQDVSITIEFASTDYTPNTGA
jgi:hypothetical protein